MFNIRLRNMLVALGIVALLAACTSTPTVDPEGKRTDEGLVNVKGSQTKRAWVNPDVDFASFDKIFVASLDVSDITIRQPRTTGMTASRDRWELTEDDKAFLQSVYAEKMSYYLFESGGYVNATTPAAGTLIISIAVTHIAPNNSKEDDMPIGMSQSYSQGAGSISIAGILKDGATGSVIGRFEDTRDTSNDIWSRNNSVRNAADVRRMFDLWAHMFEYRLDVIHGKVEE